MKKNIILLILLLSTTISTLSWAHRNNDFIVKYDKDEYKMNPFEMTAFNLGLSYFHYEPSFSKAFNSYTFDSNLTKLDLQLEVPVYKEYVSMGFELGFFKPSIKIAAHDYTFSVKFKYPISFGNSGIALTNSYRAGFITVHRMTIRPESPNGVDSNLFGGTAKIAFGIDCYLTKWLGIYAEYVVAANHMFFNKKDPNDPTKTKPNDPFSFGTSALSIGIKTTF